MNLNTFSISDQFTHENLTIFLLRGNDAFDGRRFIPLDEALEQKCIIVHETGNVGQLEIENLSEALDLYVQAGDVVKGGRRDRTLGVDFVLPAKSGRVSVPSFCVESGRWHRRAREESGSFSSSKSYLASKKLRMAAKMSKSQADRAAGGGITGVQSRIAAVTALGVVVIIVQVCIAALNEGGRAERSWKAQITGAPGRIPSKSLSLSQAAR